MKIRIDDRKSVQDALDEAEGRAQMRTISNEFLGDIAHEADARLAAMGLVKSARMGARVRYQLSIALPNAYKYRPEYTSVMLQRGSGNKWFLVNAHRKEGNLNQPEKYFLYLNKRQVEIVTRKFRESFIEMT